MNRPTRPELRTFEHFPEQAICPGCKTNDDGLTLLVPIPGTQEGHLCQAAPYHLVCYVAALQQENAKLRAELFL